MDYAVIVKLTDECNMNCAYCYHRRSVKDESRGYMTLDTISKIIEIVLDHNQRRAEFIWHGGEPLLAGIDVFKYIVDTQIKFNYKKLKLKNSVQTNGLLLNNEYISFFRQNDFHIGVSIDGPENIQSSTRGTHKEEYSQISCGISESIKAGVSIGGLCVVSPYSIGKENEIFSALINLNISNFALSPCFIVENNVINTSSSIKPEEYGLFLINMFNIWKDSSIHNIKIRNFYDAIRFFRGSKQFTCTNSNICNEYLTISPEGNIYLCDNFGRGKELLCGNIIDGIRNVNESEAMKWLVGMMNSRLPKECDLCEYKLGCLGGCKYQRFSYQHDTNQVYYYCTSRKMLYDHIKKYVPFREM